MALPDLIVMHAACYKAKAQHPVGARVSQLDRVGLPTDRPAKQVGNRPARILRFFTGARPLSRMCIQTPLGPATLVHQCTQNAIRGCQLIRGGYQSLGPPPPPKTPGSSFQISHRLDFRWTLRQPKARLAQRKPLRLPEGRP